MSDSVERVTCPLSPRMMASTITALFLAALLALARGATPDPIVASGPEDCTSEFPLYAANAAFDDTQPVDPEANPAGFCYPCSAGCAVCHFDDYMNTVRRRPLSVC